MSANEYERIYPALLREIEFYRGQIMDLVELECGDSPRWGFLRNRLLGFLGESGLEGRIALTLSSEVDSVA